MSAPHVQVPPARRQPGTPGGGVDPGALRRAVGCFFLFTGGVQPPCPDAADTNDDGNVDISDAVTALAFLFTGGAAPPAPGPEACGPDPTADGLGPCDDPAGACQ